MKRFPLVIALIALPFNFSGCLLSGDKREGVVVETESTAFTVPAGGGVHKHKVMLGIHDVQYDSLELLAVTARGADNNQMGAIEIEAKTVPEYKYRTIASRSGSGSPFAIRKSNIGDIGEDLMESMHLKFRVHRNNLATDTEIRIYFKLRYTYKD